MEYMVRRSLRTFLSVLTHPLVHVGKLVPVEVVDVGAALVEVRGRYGLDDAYGRLVPFVEVDDGLEQVKEILTGQSLRLSSNLSSNCPD